MEATDQPVKALPYFRWYPADAETDEFYSSLTDQELGFYHRCLNRSWINDGLPSGLDLLARTMSVTRKYLDRVWPSVAKGFVLTETVAPRYVNIRQEEERAIARSKSKQSSDAVSVRERLRKARSSDDVSDDVSTDHPRAYECVSVSASASKKKGSGGKDLSFPSRFAEWIKPWPRCARPDEAARAWLSVVTSEELQGAAFEARDRYLASDEVARGMVKEPSGWLHDQATSSFAGKWPAAKPKESGKSRGFVEDVERVMARSVVEKGTPW